MKTVQMRMARALIASVPMGIVLVAALVVPLSVIPGTVGFDSWPSSHGDPIAERQVRLAPPRVDVVAVRPRRAVPRQQPVLVTARPKPVRPSPAVVAIAPPPRRAPVVRHQLPGPKPDRAPQAPHRQPQAPQQPQPQPQENPSQPTKDDSGLLAHGDAPVARELPHREAPKPQAPPPAPEPVQQPAPEPQPAPAPEPQPAPAPAPRVVPAAPCPPSGGHDGGEQGDGDSQQ
jgi:hypothetical protein